MSSTETSDLRDLYQEVILDHYKRPRNFGALAAAREREGRNPLCGDEIHVYVKVTDNRIEDLKFEGTGCAISTASASLMTEALIGKTVEEADDLFVKFRKLVTADPEGPVEDDEELGKLTVLGGVREFPARVKCAGLAWHTLYAALHNASDAVTTE